MATLPVQRQPRTLMPDLAELFTGAPFFAGLRPLFDRNLIRLEDATSEGHYEVRAEIPGVDPAQDVDITVHDGLLTIKAVRSQKVEPMAGPNSAMEPSRGPFRCLPEPTSTTSKPPTKRASSPSRYRCPTVCRPRSASRSKPQSDAAASCHILAVGMR